MTPGTSRKTGWTCQNIQRYTSAKANIWGCHSRFRFFNWDEESILRENSRFQSTTFMCLITKLPQCGAISAGLQGCCQSCCWQQFSEAFVPVSVNLPAIFTLCYHDLFTNLYYITGAPQLLHQFFNLVFGGCRGMIFCLVNTPSPPSQEY